MKSIFEPETLKEVKQRINTLQPTSQRQWGKMRAAQMLTHYTAALEIAAGLKSPPRMFIAEFRHHFIKSVFQTIDRCKEHPDRHKLSRY